MSTEVPRASSWSKDSSHQGHGHLHNPESSMSAYLDPKALTSTSVKGQPGSSSGLPLSASAASSTVPVYEAKLPPQPPPPPPPSGEAPPWKVKYPEYSDAVQRVKSYEGWPQSVVGQDPRVMALCGFFYIGSADRVRCFSCGTTLRNWEPGDSPFQEHVTWAPSCTFIHRVQEPSPAEVAALPDPPRSASSVAQGNTVADSVAKNAVVAKDAPVAKDVPVAREAVVAKEAVVAREAVVVQEVTAPYVSSAASDWSSAATSQQMPGNEGSGVASADVMRSPLVLAVLEMGVPEVKVREVIRQRHLGFSSAAELYLAAEAVGSG